MATQANVAEADHDVEKIDDFYRSSKHLAIRRWLGISETPRELPPWTWVPNEDWRKLQGILSDHPEHDTTKMKANNRAEEEEHDARKFGCYGMVA